LSVIDTAETTAAAQERTGPLFGPSLCAAARTHRGTVREENEDAFLCRPDLGLFAVIDGMGGQSAGRTAAELARQALLDAGEPARGLIAAHDRIVRTAKSRRDLEGMGCVASAMRIQDGVARIAHVGDTRVYLVGSAGCEQLTRDHTVAASEQERLGLSHGLAGGLEGRNQVTRDLGGESHQGEDWFDRLEVPLEKDALILMCSDGILGALGNEGLFDHLREARRAGLAPEDLADGLIELALERGARDNITALVVKHEAEVALPESRGDWRLRVGPVLRRAMLPILIGTAAGFALRGFVGL
jgi:serine/threonine protein phosphatase PrpC